MAEVGKINSLNDWRENVFGPAGHDYYREEHERRKLAGPTICERLDRLEQQVAELEKVRKALGEEA